MVEVLGSAGLAADLKDARSTPRDPLTQGVTEGHESGIPGRSVASVN